MAESHGVPFDKIHAEANLWLNEISERMGHPDRQHAYHALRGVLFALRDRMPQVELFHFSAQLPTLIRGILFESYAPAHKPEKLSRAEFLARVSDELKTVNGGNPEDATVAVIAQLKARLGDQSLKHLRNVLPEDLQAMVDAA